MATPGMPTTHDVTRLLDRWASGDEKALADLTPLVYRELRQLAAGYLRKERNGHTLQPTALVHEAYLRLVEQNRPDWENRSHFFGVAARLMRQILVDHARRRNAGKRAGLSVPLEEAVIFRQERSRDLLALDTGLTAPEKLARGPNPAMGPSLNACLTPPTKNSSTHCSETRRPPNRDACSRKPSTQKNWPSGRLGTSTPTWWSGPTRSTTRTSTVALDNHPAMPTCGA